ncbi:MAG: hypothetical protein AB7S38_28810 [Vulcanimicrobiota bacterium]
MGSSALLHPELEQAVAQLGAATPETQAMVGRFLQAWLPQIEQPRLFFAPEVEAESIPAPKVAEVVQVFEPAPPKKRGRKPSGKTPSRVCFEIPGGSPAIKGCVVWQGPSAVDGREIALLLNFNSNKNAKTGPMVQAYILVPGVAPYVAAKDGRDRSICGDCKLRHNPETGRRPCYVTPHFGPTAIWKKWQAGDYPRLGPEVAARELAGRSVRLGAYGDPAMVPFEVWQTLLAQTRDWTGYTHQWRWCDQRFRPVLMASVDSLAEQYEARQLGWRTFRVMAAERDLTPAEILCPASDEAGNRVTCMDCRLCGGQSRQAKDVAIVVHGARKVGFYELKVVR